MSGSEVLWLSVFISLVLCCVLGGITLRINESKGYSGGFQWGFFLGILGIVIVACRPYEISYYYEIIAELKKDPQDAQFQDSMLTKLKNISSETPKSSDSVKATKRCDYCDAINDANSSFCSKCGKSFKRQ